NLLQVISGFTQVILLNKKENNPDYRKLKEIIKAGDRAAQLVRQLLFFSRKAATEKKPIDLNQELEQTLRIMERTIPKMIAIELRLASHLWNIKADPIQIEQILLNLGNNAVDAMPGGGRLVIETKNITLDENYADVSLGVTPGNYVLLSVSDTGQGMDQETIRHIFEPFYTTKEIGKGTGLGLASVYGIVKGHGGHITCYSEPGQGTNFKIYLPALEQTDTIGHRQPEALAPDGGTETILLTDDEVPIRDFASEALQRFGYKVIAASSGEEALELYASQNNKIDLVILDIGMPGMGGHRCLRELLKLDPAAKIMIASGYSINGELRKTLETGAAGYVGKPYQLDDLLNKIRTVLNEKG
ncbi:MAG: response regulator, partial [Deltaproteobacteria bacterium]|nr:response regulator [Deltaproteobacteria bacterium]